jgi:hypothetical protein
MKQQLLESFGFAAEERFPVYADRFPIQLLSYLRLSRIQDVGLFAKVRHTSRGLCRECTCWLMDGCNTAGAPWWCACCSSYM